MPVTPVTPVAIGFDEWGFPLFDNDEAVDWFTPKQERLLRAARRIRRRMERLKREDQDQAEPQAEAETVDDTATV